MSEVAPDDDVPRDAEPVELAHWLLDRARVGEAERLADYADHGMPVDLTDAGGNTLLMLAAYHGHAETVRVLAQRGGPGRAGALAAGPGPGR